ncbi:7211_t:CDS:1 [Cetraspora pellucida]|uniref:7211_t:CDS:1 n=1 Tax=Cetraspora pellucida TaxID=1433469 RepID=A0A9N9FI43_9GLOM|nr:7211_t:CDS:1 [Cetraspora pellucida]
MATHVRRKAISIDKNEKKREQEANSPEVITPIPVRPAISQLITVRPRASTRNVRSFAKVKKLRFDNPDNISPNEDNCHSVVKNCSPVFNNSQHVEKSNINLPNIDRNTLVTHLDTEDSIAKFNETSSAREITRVTLTSFVKVGGSKELSLNTPIIQNNNPQATHDIITHDATHDTAHDTTDNNSSKITDNITVTKNNDYNATIKNNDDSALNINETKDKSKKSKNKHDTQNKEKNESESSLNVKNDKKQFPCPVCKRSFSRKFNMQSHLKTHDTDRVKPYACTYESCNLRFTRKHDLKRHINGIHNEQKEFLCPHCNKNFSRKDAWKRHELTCSSEETKDVGKRKHITKPLPQLLPTPFTNQLDHPPSIIKRRGRPRKLVINNDTDLIDTIKDVTTEFKVGKKRRPRKIPKIETTSIESTEETKVEKSADLMDGVISSHTSELTETRSTEMSVDNQLIKSNSASTADVSSISHPNSMITEVRKDTNDSIDSFNKESDLISFKYHDTSSTISSINEVDYAMSEEMTEEAFGELYEETFGEKTKVLKEGY